MYLKVYAVWACGTVIHQQWPNANGRPAFWDPHPQASHNMYRWIKFIENDLYFLSLGVFGLVFEI